MVILDNLILNSIQNNENVSGLSITVEFNYTYGTLNLVYF